MLTPEQLTTLAAAIAAQTDPEFVSLRTAGATGAMADWYNVNSTFVVRRSSVESAEIGPTLNYDAVRALTTINRDKCTTFLALNASSFNPTADVESYWEDALAGTLNGQGAATRAALLALWRRFATRGEALFATGTGTTASPGRLVFEGRIENADIVLALGL